LCVGGCVRGATSPVLGGTAGFLPVCNTLPDCVALMHMVHHQQHAAKQLFVVVLGVCGWGGWLWHMMPSTMPPFNGYQGFELSPGACSWKVPLDAPGGTGKSCWAVSLHVGGSFSGAGRHSRLCPCPSGAAHPPGRSRNRWCQGCCIKRMQCGCC
jgi:hypothetical protein